MLMSVSGSARRVAARSFRSGSCHGWAISGTSRAAAAPLKNILASSRWFATLPTDEEDAAPATKAGASSHGFEKADELKNNLKPSEIVAALDRHIVGQQDAKKAVAIAMRNRWRRRQLPDELRKEVTPRNVLLVGPTGT